MPIALSLYVLYIMSLGDFLILELVMFKTLLKVAAAYFSVQWHGSSGAAAFLLSHKKYISMSFKYYSLVLTLQ